MWFNQTADLFTKNEFSDVSQKTVYITRPSQTLCRPYRLTLDRPKNESSRDGVQKHDQKQKDVREPLATPLGELWVDPHDRLFAHAQPALCELVESLEMLRHKVAGTLRLNVLKELVAVEGKIRWMYAGCCGVWLHWYGHHSRWVSFVDEVRTWHDERDFGPNGAGRTEAAACWGGHFLMKFSRRVRWWYQMLFINTRMDDDSLGDKLSHFFFVFHVNLLCREFFYFIFTLSFLSVNFNFVNFCSLSQWVHL